MAYHSIEWWAKNKPKIIKLYSMDKHNLRFIASNFDVSHTTICKRLDEWGVVRRQGDGRRGILVKSLCGLRRGKLLVMGRDGNRYPIRWVVKCDCGNETSMLRHVFLKSYSCGCVKKRKGEK